MSELITKHCASLQQLKETNQTYQYREDILNDLHAELTRLQVSDPTSFRQEINTVTSLLRENILQFDQTISTFFLNYFIELLKQWQELTYFKDSNDANTFENLSIILTECTQYCAEQSLLEQLNQTLRAIGRIGKDLFTSRHIKVITCILRAYTLIECQNGYHFMDVTPLDDSIIECLCSPYSIETFGQFSSSVKSDERSISEDFVFNALFYHISWLNRDELEQKANQLREHLLPSIGDLLDVYLTSCVEWQMSAIRTLTDLTTVFLYSVQMTLTTDINIDTQKHICDTAIRILLETPNISMKLKNNCLQYVYMGTPNDKVLDYLKSKSLTSTMFNIANMYKSEKEIQFNVYRILAAIMTEEDIKRLDDPGAIAKVFIDHLEEIKNLSGWETRIKNLLATLKILLQHDQIRDEIYKQNGVKLFIYCVTQPRYGALIHQRALENLLIMSFDERVQKELNENPDFLTQIESMAEDNKEPDVQHAAESLLWMLEKEETTQDSQSDKPLENAYDVMISYSHKDKDLCFQLYDRLKKDKFRVWLDRDQMHGTPLEAMSNAIEQSEFVFVCMSDSYKQSGYCKMEAYYALERQCSIIPLVMKVNYKPDGWLGIIVTGRMRIDFPKYGFDDAYNKLMVEIDRNRKEKKTTTNTQHHDIPLVSKAPHETPIKEDKPIEKVKYQEKSGHRLPSTIEQWTDDDVQQFCLKQKLECFLPICERMNGKQLQRLYQMCTSNSPVMFQSLNHQYTMTNNHSNKSTIEIIEYLQFLDDLKPFVPVTIEKTDTTGPRSSACAIL